MNPIDYVIKLIVSLAPTIINAVQRGGTQKQIVARLQAECRAKIIEAAYTKGSRLTS